MKLIPLTQGKVAMVDDEDFDRVNQFKWCACFDGNNWYARRAVNGNAIQMHAFVLDVPRGTRVDHRHGDGLNNQKYNLRTCTQHNNVMNRGLTKNRPGHFKGVTLDSKGKLWRAMIGVNGKLIRIGRFDDPVLAAISYDMAAHENFGEFARTNHQMGLY